MVATLPVELRGKRVKDLKDGEGGWVRSYELTIDADWGLWLCADAIVHKKRRSHCFQVRVVPQGLAVFWDDQAIQDSGDLVEGDLVPDPEALEEAGMKYLPVAVFDNSGKIC